jgi:two-component system, NtrC family, response regulator AtoC
MQPSDSASPFAEYNVVSTAAAPQPSILNDLPPSAVIFGQSAAMLKIKRTIDCLDGSIVPVLIQGESGTGKEIVAKLLHACSAVCNGPFVKVNCPAIPGTLLESELFGYERGAFTGALTTKPGRVEAAHGGSLFLDEIGELDINLQAKLLQLLQDGRFWRVGAQTDKRVGLRIISATNRVLQHEIARGAFRQDLLYRINVMAIELVPLRNRIEDVPALAKYFIERYSEQFKRRPQVLSTSTTERLKRYTWPGNIRELENVIRRYVILQDEEVIGAELESTSHPYPLPFSIPLEGPCSLKKMTKDAVRQIEQKAILQVLEANAWSRKRTAEELNISYRALLYKIKEMGLRSKRRTHGSGETEDRSPVS